MINGNGTVDYELIPPNAHKISLEHQVSVTGHQFITDVYQAHERTSHHCATAIKLKICINCLAVPLFIEGLFIRDICIYIFVTTCATIGPIFLLFVFLNSVSSSEKPCYCPLASTHVLADSSTTGMLRSFYPSVPIIFPALLFDDL